MDNIELIIQNGQTIYYPVTEEGITWETERTGTPGKLTFNILKDDVIKIEEGNAVRMKLGETNVFYGFIFTKKYDKDDKISIICYDQLRYLKNKDSYIYTNKKANELITMIASDFNLNIGTIEDTAFIIEKRDEDNQTLFDIIQNALDLTLSSTNKIYVLYDDFSKLTLKNIESESMQSNILIDNESAENYSFSSSIDSNSYDQIRLAYDNKETGKREFYMAKDSSNINKWGVLQYFEKIQESTNGQVKAEALLKLYNKKNRGLTISNVLGNVSLRAGVSPILKLDLGDVSLYNRMLIEKAKHTFKNGEHLMDLTLKGANIFDG